MEIIWRVSSYLFRHKGLFALTLSLAIGSMLFMLAVPLVIGWVVDGLIDSAEMNQLGFGMLCITLCFAFRELLNCFRIRVNNVLEQKVLIALRADLHAKLLELPVSFYDRRKSGEIASRVVDDVNNVERALLDGTEQGIASILLVLGIITILLVTQPLLAVFVILPLPIIIFLAIDHAKATRKNWSAVRETAGELNSLLVEDIQANRLIHSFALQDREKARFNYLAELMRKRTLKAMFRWSIYSPTSNFIASIGTVAVVGVGGYLLNTSADFTFGDFVAFFAFCRMLYEPISLLNGLNHMLAAGKASGERVFEILDHPVEIENLNNPAQFPQGLITVKYENVSFSYPERDQVINDFELELPAGNVTALVGHTGAGKSTIANLLLRYYDVSEGAVLLNDVDIRNIDLVELRGHIGYVAQEPFLFDGTVEDNLRLANKNATNTEIITALQGAKAWDFVSKLPKGMKTMIGERGIRLSMGEKQRITIARVLLKNPPLVIFDEATSSVDTLTEQKIQDALEVLMRNRTVLVIAHRLSTVRRADQIVVMDNGKIIEVGHHEQLLLNSGRYSQLWNIQHDFIPETV